MAPPCPSSFTAGWCRALSVDLDLQLARGPSGAFRQGIQDRAASIPYIIHPDIPEQLVGAADAQIRTKSIAKYRKHAANYDASCGPTWPIHERAVAALQLRSGQRVLDVGCGTSLSLALLAAGAWPDEG